MLNFLRRLIRDVYSFYNKFKQFEMRFDDFL